MNIDELAQFLFVNQFSKCSHCAYYGDICNGEFFDEKSCTEGIKRFLSSDDDVDLRMQEFRAKVASGEQRQQCCPCAVVEKIQQRRINK